MLMSGAGSMTAAAQPPKTTVTLLVENSRFSRWMLFGDIQTVVLRILDATPDDCCYALASYSGYLHIDADLTTRKQTLREALASLPEPLWGRVATYDAVYTALDDLWRIPGHKVLVIIGSGYNSISEHTLNEIERMVRESGVEVYAVGIGSRLRGDYEPYLHYQARMNLAQGETFLRMIARDSGGEAWFPQGDEAFRRAAASLAQALNGGSQPHTKQFPTEMERKERS